MLRRARVLIVEDDILTGMDLACAVELADGEPLGPLPTVEAGLALLDEHGLSAAILDVQLEDRDITPLAMRLLASGLAVIFHTGSEIPREITDGYGHVQICRKPMLSEHVVLKLALLIDRAAPTGGVRDQH